MDESLDGLSKDQLKKMGAQAGKDLAQYLDYKTLDSCYKHVNGMLDDKMAGFIVDAVPADAKEEAFDFLAQDDIDDFYDAVVADSSSDDPKFPNSGDVLDNAFNTNERIQFIDDLLTELILDSTSIDEYGDGSLGYESYHKFAAFEEDIPDDNGIVDKVCTFCSSFCDAYSAEYLKKMQARDGTSKFIVTTRWYVPEMRSEEVEARDIEEANAIIDKKYAYYYNSHSEDQDLYNGVHNIEKT